MFEATDRETTTFEEEDIELTRWAASKRTILLSITAYLPSLDLRVVAQKLLPKFASQSHHISIVATTLLQMSSMMQLVHH